MNDLCNPADYVFDGMRIPDGMAPGLLRYIRYGIEPGAFLSAVLCNDLRGACERADSQNIKMLPAYVSYLYNEAPSLCWGSEEKFRSWIKKGGVVGINAALVEAGAPA